jgi:hypothetical protein
MLRIVVTNLGNIAIGEEDVRSTTDLLDELCILNPREIQIAQQGNQTKFAILPLLGNPSVIIYRRSSIAFHYVVEEENLINLYQQSTSKIAKPSMSMIANINKRQN